MRIYVEGTPDLSLTELIAERGLTEGKDVLRIAAVIEHPLTHDRKAVSLKSMVELGVAMTPEVTQYDIDCFFREVNVQERLRQILELSWSLEHDMMVALNIDFCETTSQLALEHTLKEKSE